MFRSAAGKLVFIGLSLLGVALLVAAGFMITGRVVPRTLTIAAVGPGDEGYVLMQALRSVAAREGGNISIALRQTSGTEESLRLLEQGQVQMAVAESWMTPGPNARNLASLFPEVFFLFANKDSEITSLPDLKGERIALPKGGAQFQSFLSLAAHYGMQERDFEFVGGNEERANQAFLKKDTAARFMIGPVNKPEIAGFSMNGSVLNLEPSLAVIQPGLIPMTLPKGTISANPTAPTADLHTLSSQRLLYARADLDNWAAERILGLLSDRRYEVAAAIPPTAGSVRALVSRISAPVLNQAVSVPVHPGAAIFFSPHPPSFVAQNADVFALVVALIIVVLLWVAEFQRFSQQNSKAKADKYRGKVLKLMREAQTSTDPKALGAIPGELLVILADAVDDLEHRVLTDDSFQSLSAVWDVAYRFARERSHSKGAGPADHVDTGDAEAVKSSDNFSFSKLVATVRSR